MDRRDVITLVSSLLLAAAVVYVLVTTAVTNSSIRAQYETLHEQYAGLYEEAVVAGAEPEAPAPEEVPEADDSAPQISVPEAGPTGPPGERGPGPTQAQVVQALSRFCADNDCTPTPTVDQVAAAISDFCSDGACRGEDGENGQNGTDGENGRAPTAEEIGAAVAAFCADGSCRGADGEDGKQGPPPSDEQVRAQVAVYCAANNECRGPEGPEGDAGQTGERGPQGIGIKSITCPESGDWVITLTDDSVQTVTGPCRVAPIITP